MAIDLNLITKEELITSLKQIEAMGWIENTTRKTNDGAAGNMLEDLLGIPENNLPIPNAAEWELKTHKEDSSSLVTLFHTEPSPRAAGIVPRVLLPLFGWEHQEAGKKYPANEKSFRATIDTTSFTRGFYAYVNNAERKICIGFNAEKVLEKDHNWLTSVIERLEGKELPVTPYWNLDEIYGTMRNKLLNCFYVLVERKKINHKDYFHFYKAYMLKDFSIERFIEQLNSGNIKIDFDARTGHNHGTKCRIKQNLVPSLYANTTIVLDAPKLK